MTARELLDELRACGVELTCLYRSRRTNRVVRRGEGDPPDAEYDLEPIWPILPAGHPDREVVDRAKTLWDRSAQFRHWLEHAHMTREAGWEGPP